MIRTRVDLRDYDRMVSRLIIFCRVDSIRISANVVITGIKDRTGKSKDYRNHTFQYWTPFGTKKKRVEGKGPYSPSQERNRRIAGVQTTKKDLSVTGNLLNSLGLMGNFVSVADEYQEIAHGQMYNPRWRYHHEFLFPGIHDDKKISSELVKGINRL